MDIEDTEWNDALRAQGILPPKSGPTKEEVRAAEDQAVLEALERQNSLEDKDLDELDELEDELDDRILEEYRKKRIAEMQAMASKEKFGTVEQISEPDFVREVTQASKDVWVVVHLFQYSIPACQLMNKYLIQLAAKNRAVKFLKIIATDCIRNYPDRNLPTLLIYGEGDIKKQMVGIGSLGGLNMKLSDLETCLKRFGVPLKDERVESDEDSE